MKLLIYLLTAISIISCSSSNEIITVASQQRDCQGVAPQKCLLIKENNNPNWMFWYTGIEGFNYQEGNEYKLEIKKEKVANPAADASSIKYILVKEISKTPKVSENLP